MLVHAVSGNENHTCFFHVHVELKYRGVYGMVDIALGYSLVASNLCWCGDPSLVL